MSQRIERQLQGKFKNIPFKVRKEAVKALGQKYVIHDYFNSSARYAEAQGKLPDDFSVDIFFSGDNPLEDYKQFKAALEDPTPGTLILPTFGVYTSIIGYGGSSESSQTAIGEINLTVSFTKTIARPSPSNQAVTSEDVAAQAQATREALNELMEEVWEVPNTVNNITTASTDFKSMARDVASRAQGLLRATQQFSRRIDNALRSPALLARLLLNPASPIGYLQNVATGVTGGSSFRTFGFVATIGNNQPNAMNDINAGIRPTPSTGVVQPDPAPAIPDTTVPLWPDDTAEREQRNNNRAAAVNVFRLIGLIGMYEAASVQAFTTTEDIDRVKSQLDLYYSLIVEEDTAGVLIQDIKTEISRLRGTTNQVLRQKRQNAFAVVEIDVPMYTPVTLLAYDLYGERIQTEAQLNYIADIIKGLNMEMPAHRLIGTVRVVEIR